jgi:hypothetical protein
MEAALLYVDIYLEPEKAHRKILLQDPVPPAYGRLRYAHLIQVDLLPPILDMAEALVDQLRAERGQPPLSGGNTHAPA